MCSERLTTSSRKPTNCDRRNIHLWNPSFFEEAISFDVGDHHLFIWRELLQPSIILLTEENLSCLHTACHLIIYRMLQIFSIVQRLRSDHSFCSAMATVARRGALIVLEGCDRCGKTFVDNIFSFKFDLWALVPCFNAFEFNVFYFVIIIVLMEMFGGLAWVKFRTDNRRWEMKQRRKRAKKIPFSAKDSSNSSCLIAGFKIAWLFFFFWPDM